MSKMNVKNLMMKISYLLLFSTFLFSSISYAHLLSITATTPFPSTVFTRSTTIATFTVTNTTSRVPITVIDQSRFPKESGLSISSTTCGRIMAPGESCTISVTLRAPSAPQKISAELKEWAKPSADGVRFPFAITIVNPPRFTITPSAGTGGSVSPNSPQTVTSGDSLVFTASPQSGYIVNQWLLDGTLAQTGGTTYTLSNITANHTVEVTFSSGLFAVGNYVNQLLIQRPLIFSSSTNGNSWLPKTITLPSNFINNELNASACTDVNCIATGIYRDSNDAINKPLLLFSNTGGNSWLSIPSPYPPDFVSSAVVRTAVCESNICVTAGAYFNGVVVKALILVSNDSGASWVAADPVLPTDFVGAGSINTLTCLGSTCVAAGSYERPSGLGTVQVPLLLVSTNAGATWASVTPTLPPTFNSNGSINSVTCEGNVCIGTGVFFEVGFQIRPLVLRSTDLGASWGFVTPTLPSNFFNFGFFNAVTCTGAVCNGAGNYNDGSQIRPLLFHSADSGATWSSVNTTLPANFFDATSLRSITCLGSNCMAAGDYIDNSFVQFPMLLVTNNQGSSWTAFDLTIPNDFSDFGTINGLTCSGNVCTAVGQYTNQLSMSLPLIYVSSDGGTNWTLVPPTLPGDFQNSGILNSTSGTL